MYKGQDSACAVAVETTEGQRPTTVDQQPSGVVQDVEPGETIEYEEVRGQGGDRNYKEVNSTTADYSLNVPILVQDVKIFEYILGSVSEDTTGAGSAPYTHKIQEAQTLGTLTFEELQTNQDGSDDLVRTFLGCYSDTATLSSEVGGHLEAELEWMVRDIDDTNTADSTSLLSKRPFKHSDLNTCTWGGSGVPTDTNTGPQSIEMEISNNPEGVPEEGSILTAQHEALNREYSITITANPDDTTHYTSWRDESTQDMVIQYQRATGDYIKFTFTDATMEEPGFPAPSEDLVEAEFSFTARSLEIEVNSDSSTYSLS